MAAESPTLISALTAVSLEDQRVAPRFGVAMPYTVNGHAGQTRDLSATGLRFDSDTPHQVGSVIELTLRYGLDGHNFPMKCQVEVVRVEERDGRFTIAARWCEPFTDPDA